MREDTKDWIIMTLVLAVLFLTIFAETIINQVPVKECIKWNGDKCEREALIWNNYR